MALRLEIEPGEKSEWPEAALFSPVNLLSADMFFLAVVSQEILVKPCLTVSTDSSTYGILFSWLFISLLFAYSVFLNKLILGQL